MTRNKTTNNSHDHLTASHSISDENWLDVMPTIPLARGVPVIVTPPNRSRKPYKAVVISVAEPPGRVVFVHTGSLIQGPKQVDPDTIRVDLNNSQGVGYALHEWWPLCGATATLEQAEWHEQMVWRWMQDMINDDDCLAIARALCEVAE